MNRIKSRLLGALTALLLTFTCIAAAFPQIADKVSAASVDYPALTARISTYDNSRNLNITGTADKTPLNTWPTNGGLNENWRFDLVGSDSNGSYYKIVNQGSGRLITPMMFATDANTEIVLFGSTTEASQHWYVLPVGQDALGNDLHYKIVNYSAPDMALTYAGESSITLTKYTGASNQKWLLNAAGLQGFAGYSKEMNGSAKASVIGGMLGKIVEVDTFDELKSACTSTEPMTIVITKNISGKTGSGNYEISTGYDGGKRYYCRDNYIYLQPDKTIIGSYGANTLHNVYFRTYNEQWGPADNVIIRNIRCTHDTELNSDNIWEFAYGWNFWIDHCYFEGHNAINTCSLGSTDWDKFLNFKGTSDYITISDCRFGLHEYGVLLGYPTDDEATYKVYNGKPCVTLANNYYKDTITRAPALMRYGYFHSLNNYVYNFSMGYTVHTACKTYAENCYYDGASTKGSVICDWNQITFPGAYAESGSIFKNCGRTVRGQGTSKNPSYSVDCTWRPTSNYTYKALTAEAAKTYCETYSGSQNSAAKMNYAIQPEAGIRPAGYVEAPTEEMTPPEPISGVLVQNLNVTDTTRSAWSIDTDLRTGDLVFGDRDVVWRSIPAGLLGGEAIVTACDAKNAAGDNLAAFTAGADMTVWIALDQRVEAVPAWMADYQKSSLTMENNKDVVFDLYSRRVKQNETITLGANGQSAYCVNYAIIAVRPQADVTADGVFDAKDIAALQSYLLGTGSLANATAAEVNPDGQIDGFDLAIMKRMLREQETAAPEEPVTEPTTEPATEPPTEAANTYEPDGFRFSGNVYLVGDSTVCEYDSNTASSLDRYGWGMKLAEQYNGVTVHNLALSGRSSRSFLTEKNYQTLKASLGAGDYLFIQFGHNDEKTDESTYPGLGTYPGLDWGTLDNYGKDAQGRYSYEFLLAAYYVNLAKNAGAVPVLVTPITRRSPDGTPYYQAHTEYQKGMITLGAMYNVPVIDMTDLTTKLYNQVGASNSASFHCWQDAAHTTIDNTHLSSKGASEIAGIIAEQTNALGLTIGRKLK